MVFIDPNSPFLAQTQYSLTKRIFLQPQPLPLFLKRGSRRKARIVRILEKISVKEYIVVTAEITSTSIAELRARLVELGDSL